MTQWEIIFQRFFCLPWRIMFSDVYLAWVPRRYWFYNEFKCCEFSTSRLYKTVGLVVRLGRCHGLAWVHLWQQKYLQSEISSGFRSELCRLQPWNYLQSDLSQLYTVRLWGCYDSHSSICGGGDPKIIGFQFSNNPILK